MNPIFQNNGYFFVVPDKEINPNINVNEIDELVYDSDRKKDVYLFNGRVHVWYGNNVTYFVVDGITICSFLHSKYCSLRISYSLSVYDVANNLTRIAKDGITKFLTDHRESVNSIKNQVEELISRMSEEQKVNFIEKKEGSIKIIRDCLLEIICYIESLNEAIITSSSKDEYGELYKETISKYFV